MMELMSLFKENFTLGLNSEYEMTRYAMMFCAVANGVKMFYDNYICDLEFICGDKNFKKEIIDNCLSLKKGVYYPTIYLPSSFL